MINRTPHTIAIPKFYTRDDPVFPSGAKITCSCGKVIRGEQREIAELYQMHRVSKGEKRTSVSQGIREHGPSEWRRV